MTRPRPSEPTRKQRQRTRSDWDASACSDSLALVVPTRGDRPYLPGIVAAAGCPVWVIATRPDVQAPGATVIEDLGPVNIQRWWNRGIDASGAPHVALLNDDVTYDPGLIQAMSAELDTSGAAICFTAPDGITGWAFMVDTRLIRPDERFAWYFGDTDLRAQAIASTGVARVPADVQHHHPGELTARDQSLQSLADQDRAAFAAKWPG